MKLILLILASVMLQYYTLINSNLNSLSCPFLKFTELSGLVGCEPEWKKFCRFCRLSILMKKNISFDTLLISAIIQRQNKKY
ncbi:hypothetical protein BpHYR1_023008 [Brachionus plicatilis]|uniref:Uncharacterized protein n=1 Tax=Brachionus plicatilis TaxID=10195 RepID=A0A3M7QFC3_BRAPC|nr:hypothetical protein BpHYR1_023008 [Brachionus plicatilis]